MALEAATYIGDLVSTNPAGSDQKKEGDDHIRLIKAALKATFPTATGAIPISTYIKTLLDDADAATARATLVAAGLPDANVFTGVNTIRSADATASEIVALDLDRFSASPANSDLLMALRWLMRDSGGGTDVAAKIVPRLLDVTAGSEDAEVGIYTPVAGTLAERVIVGQGLYAVGVTGTDKGVGTANFTKYYAAGDQALPITDLTEDTAPVNSADFLLTRDISASLYKKVKPEKILTVDKVAGTLSISNTTTETSLYLFTIPANRMGVLGCLDVDILADVFNNSGAGFTITLRVKVNGTITYEDVTASIVSNATFSRPFWLELKVRELNVTGAQFIAGHLMIGNVVAATTGLGDLATAPFQSVNFDNNGTAGGDTTADWTVEVTVQFSVANAAISMTRRSASARIF